MTASGRRDLVVLVLGRPGETARRYRVRRGTLLLLALALPSAGLVAGYVLGRRAALATIVPVTAASERETVAAPLRSAEAPAAPATPAASAAVAAQGAGETARLGSQAEAASDAGVRRTAVAPATAAAPAGEPFVVLPKDPSQEPLELHPFAPDGSARASDFASLQNAMACGSGHSVEPDAALVRALVAAQQHFGKPLLFLGGRCAAHDDHAEADELHRKGRAADVRVRGVSSEQLMAWFVERDVGGAGRYKRGGFVHIDVRSGPHQTWDGEEPPAKGPAPAASDPGERAATPSANTETAVPAAPAPEAPE